MLNLINNEIMLHCVNIWLLDFAEAHCRKTNVERYKYFGLCSKFISCFNCSNLKKSLVCHNLLKHWADRRTTTDKNR